MEQNIGRGIMDKGRLFVVSGPSGTGKGTICKEIVNKLDLVLSVSMTTRGPRKGEIDNESYIFVDKATFMDLIKNNGFLEYAEVYGNWYGTPKKFAFEQLDKGKDVILEIDIQGALKVKEVYPKGVFIFILPPSMAELRKRITGRGTETSENMNMRLTEALKEVSYIDKYDYCVINDKLEVAVDRVEDIINAEHCRVSDHIYNLIEKYKEEI